MNQNEFLRQLDDEQIVAAIAQAERRTSGEIRLYVTDLPRGDALAAARVRFEKMRMHRTRERNAVLIYFVPRSRAFAIVGDTGIDAKCRASFWNDIATGLHADLKKQRATDAIVSAIHKIGEALATHFPALPNDTDELPNAIERE